jgi:drug/metabolite transporter (DMT)-like permease
MWRTVSYKQSIVSARRARVLAFAFLALANLLWAGNWVTGRALRDAFDPITLNFWRWLIAALVLAPFALHELARTRDTIRRHAGLLALLALLALTGVVIFQSLVYLGLRTTTAINAVLLNSSAPLFMLLCSWIIERESATRRQVAGMLVSLVGILVIVSQGEVAKLLELEFHPGDAWILLAMPAWGIYSVLLKRRPPELGGVSLLFAISVAGLAMLAPAFVLEALHAPPRWPTTGEAAGVLYVGLAASVGAFICWNRGVAVVGANAAGFTLHLLPAFGTVLAMVALGEAFHAFHAAGIAIILVGVVLAARAVPAARTRNKKAPA